MEVTQLDIGGSVLRRRLIPTKDTHFYGDSFLRGRLIFYAGDWFSQRTFILTGVTHFHRGHIFYEGDSFPRKHSFLRSRLLSKAETNEWVARNRVLVLAQRFLGSPQGEHCNSLENGRFDYLYVHIFYRSSRDLPFLDKILQRVRGEKRQLKSLWIFLDKLSLDRWISFFIAYFILPKGNSSVKIIFISADDDVSPLRRHIFRHRNLFI